MVALLHWGLQVLLRGWQVLGHGWLVLPHGWLVLHRGRLVLLRGRLVLHRGRLVLRHGRLLVLRQGRLLVHRGMLLLLGCLRPRGCISDRLGWLLLLRCILLLWGRLVRLLGHKQLHKPVETSLLLCGVSAPRRGGPNGARAPLHTGVRSSLPAVSARFQPCMDSCKGYQLFRRQAEPPVGGARRGGGAERRESDTSTAAQ